MKINPSIIQQIAQKDPNKIFSLNPTCTYEQLEWTITYIADQLKRADLQDQVLLVLAHNNLAHVCLALACLRAEVIYAPINKDLAHSQLQNLIDHYHFKNIYREEHTPTDLNNINYIKLDLTLQTTGTPCKDQETINLNLTRLANLTFTSGSTGIPKAVALSLKAHFASAKGAESMIPILENDRYLLTLPIFHVGGFAIIIKTILAHSSIVFSNNSHSLKDELLKFGVTHVSLVPTQLYRLFEQGFNFNQSNIKALLLGGAAISKDLLLKCLEQGIKPYISYGLSEMASQVCTKRVDFNNINESNVGVLLPYRELTISPNNEILVKGDTLFMGYYDGKRLNLKLDENGFFNTKDLGALATIDNRTYLKVFGRLDHQFISGGENIQPEEIEKTLLSNPEINRCIILGIPDQEWGHKAIALVDTSLDAQELKEFCKLHLTRHQIPKQFYDLNKLRIDQSFKLKRKEILQQFLDSNLEEIH